MPKCSVCGKKFERGIYDSGKIYCSENCADKDWQENRADNWAEFQSEGLYRNYEDYMENELGATILS